MRCGVVVFPGSNCDHDVYHVLKHVLDQEVLFLWHGDADLRDCQLVVLPGGFSYGDYLRAGAMAVHSPILEEVRRHAESGGQVLGICNGFQILLETGLLDGAMRRNRSLRFECRDVYLRVERDDLPFTSDYDQGQVLRMPIAHAEGSYIGSEEMLDELEESSRVVFRYVTPDGADATGEDEERWNVNGSARAIAGVCNEAGNVLGMMPHPERCAEQVFGNVDGLAVFAAVAGAGARGLGVLS
ncbi:MAG: phosphoribosylformylglycinamidine synthase subunit PurQ [bacterium]|nr:phosphoribosylformylglycinamidine synthase subunit PurQ [bacterium]